MFSTFLRSSEYTANDQCLGKISTANDNPTLDFAQCFGSISEIIVSKTTGSGFICKYDIVYRVSELPKTLQVLIVR